MLFSFKITAILAFARMVSAQAAPAPAPTGAAAVAAAAAKAKVAQFNQDFYNYIFIVLAGLTVALILWRVGIESVKYVRTLACLNNDTQRYFITPSLTFARFKKHLIYAPVFSKRHNKEFKLSAAMNVGTLPTRFQLLFLAGYLGTNIAFCVVSIQWEQDVATAAKQLRNRSGILSVVNMVCDRERKT